VYQALSAQAPCFGELDIIQGQSLLKVGEELTQGVFDSGDLQDFTSFSGVPIILPEAIHYKDTQAINHCVKCGNQYSEEGVIKYLNVFKKW
jgi:hypothetical protein